MNKKTNILLWGGVAAGIVLIGLCIWLAVTVNNQQNDLEFLQEQYAIEKEELADEYSQLAIEYEGYKLNVNNDSLEQKLEDQRIKIQQLVEELKQTKKEDAREIARLKKELTNLRTVMRYYVAQIDSLNTVNEALVAENKEVKKQMRTVNNENANLTQRNEELTKKVDIAAHLIAQNLSATAQNKRNKNTTSLKNTTTFVVSFNIAANVTTKPGEKDIYVRILRPSEELLTNAKSGTFSYDGSNIEYSMKKSVEYSGEELPVTLYWNRNETLDPGTYQFEVYADGKLMGRTKLTMEK